MFTEISAKQTYEAAFQGTHGAFSEDAAHRLLPPYADLMPCSRLEDVFEAVDNGTVRYGVIPVENTLAGSVHRAYDLLFECGLTIVRETVCRIEHTLIGLAGAKLDQIHKVLSHPVALAQCENFFHANPWIEPVPVYDTAGAVALVLKNADVRWASIASRRAAELLGGEVLKESIQDYPENYTRFLLISKPMEMVKPQSLNYKRTIVFRIAHEPGALWRALQPFAVRGIDITKIESRPVKGSRFEYMFYLDLAGKTDYDETHEAVEELRAQALSLRVLGMYPQVAMP